jgi:hypothetical protein
MAITTYAAESGRGLNGGTEKTHEALNRIAGMTVNFHIRHLKNTSPVLKFEPT